MTTTQSVVHPLVGKTIEGLYPASNHRHIPPRLEHRRLRIDAVRNPTTEPLDPTTLALDPLLRREGLLVTGVDLDKGAERSFYLGSFVDPRLTDDATALDGFQIVGTKAGRETVLHPFIDDAARAERCVAMYDADSGLTGIVAELRPVTIPKSHG